MMRRLRLNQETSTAAGLPASLRECKRVVRGPGDGDEFAYRGWLYKETFRKRQQQILRLHSHSRIPLCCSDFWLWALAFVYRVFLIFNHFTSFNHSF